MIDAVVVLILIVFALVGRRRGLVRSALTLVSSAAALFMSFVAYPLINTVLKLTPLYTMVHDAVLIKVQAIDFGQGIQDQGNAIIKNINWLPSMITDQIKCNNNSAMYELLGVSTLQEYIATYITNIIISLIAIFVTWFVIKVVLIGVLRMIGGIVEHLPVISTFNRGGGLIFGLIKGLLTLSIIGLIIPMFTNFPSFQALSDGIEASILTKWLYDNNFIVLIYNMYLA